MPKLKTHKATVKRVRKTGSGILMRDKAAISHLLTHKSDRKMVPQKLAKGDAKKVKKLAPYL